MTTIKTGSITANGNNIEFIEKGDGPLFLCMHGFPDHAHSFVSQLHHYSKLGYRVVAPFMRGYGPKLNEESPTYKAFDTGRDILALIDAFEEENAIVLGHDFGASAAYAAAYMAPKKINKLITAAVPYGRQFITALLADPEQQRRSWYMFFFLTPFAETAVAHNNFAFIDRLWADWSPGWTPDRDYMDKLKETFAKPGALKHALTYYCHLFDGIEPSQARMEFKAGFGKTPIHVPTLYLHGENDGCIGADLNVGMQSLFPAGLTYRSVENAGHFLHLEKPDHFNQHIDQFLNSSE